MTAASLVGAAGLLLAGSLAILSLRAPTQLQTSTIRHSVVRRNVAPYRGGHGAGIARRLPSVNREGSAVGVLCARRSARAHAADTAAAAAAPEFPALQNDLIIRAATGQPTERVPIWMHRQAGRYLPEFRNFSDRFPFMHRCSTPEIATRLTVQPVERYGLDAAIIFSDILVLLPVLGIEWGMVKGKGPCVQEPINSPEDLIRVSKPSQADIKSELGYVMEALTRSRMELDGRATLIGFSGAPWTLLGYMVQGEGAKSTQAVKAKGFLYQHPDAAHKLLSTITDAVVLYLVEQVRAGAQMVQVFDSWAGELTPSQFAEFSTPYLKAIATKVKQSLKDQGLPQVPVSVFPKGACSHALKDLAQSDYDVVSLDWGIDPAVAREQAPNKVLQGNLDPSILYLPKEVIQTHTQKMINSFGTQNYIANLGYAVDKSMDPELVGSFVDEVRGYSSYLNNNQQELTQAAEALVA
uniref:Uroporphyrinogen decarboxylase n=1 Tax=Lotharella oceanica TaxID=641309 RepID=A0A7S2XH60_9EUKA|mmetsp:Transcript_8686/g.17042  ORF Transcript_8686/g.17042 Transcript_8686/m.17042 type:complete len:467 (+) Transcript_8686:3-1403(+)